VLLYNIPQCTHAPLVLETVAALAAEPRVLGVKDSWGDLTYFQSLLDLKRNRPSFRVLQGHEHVALASLLLGADGLIPGLANVAPRLMVDLVTAARAGDLARCNRLHHDVFELTGMYTQKLGLAGLYAACAQLGLARNIPAEPWVAVGGTHTSTIDGLLRKHGLLPAVARA
jgi:4-hydroxy-tetrahydrodipicolinate synthase